MGVRFEVFETEKGRVYVNVDEVAAIEKSRDDVILRLKDGHEYILVREDAHQVYVAITNPAHEGE